MLGLHGNVASDGPQEGGQFAGDGRDGDVGVLASGAEAADTRAEPALGLPGDVLNGRGEALESVGDDVGELGGMAGGPRGFHQGTAGHGRCRSW